MVLFLGFTKNTKSSQRTQSFFAYRRALSVGFVIFVIL